MSSCDPQDTGKRSRESAGTDGRSSPMQACVWEEAVQACPLRTAGRSPVLCPTSAHCSIPQTTTPIQNVLGPAESCRSLSDGQRPLSLRHRGSRSCSGHDHLCHDMEPLLAPSDHGSGPGSAAGSSWEEAEASNCPVQTAGEQLLSEAGQERTVELPKGRVVAGAWPRQAGVDLWAPSSASTGRPATTELGSS